MWSAAVCSKFSCMQVVNVYQVVGFDPWWVTQILHKCVVEVNLQVDVLSSHCFVRFVRVLHNLHILDYLFNKFWLQGLRERWLADPRFLQRLAIEETISITTTLIAQYERRGYRFWKEIEYVITDSAGGSCWLLHSVVASTHSFLQDVRCSGILYFWLCSCRFSKPLWWLSRKQLWVISGLKCSKPIFFLT